LGQLVTPKTHNGEYDGNPAVELRARARDFFHRNIDLERSVLGVAEQMDGLSSLDINVGATGTHQHSQWVKWRRHLASMDSQAKR
jgi:hypothetical protein